MPVAAKRILAVHYELIKHLPPSPPKWASIFYGRQNTLAVNGATTRWRARGASPRVLPHGAAGEYTAAEK